ncbi:hypothetical protein PR202_ga11003 [Eleusine coracana subsp. coracana]|uniref:Uncharacterized protein n=1 Tax=Eleusine coracana subsp. coracana TaxID=191504 RepID=A0AAV5C8F4_ELECO|nr:hypothetical protein PR202_ga11003 [Eleusine coracana subsp. coracana]
MHQRWASSEIISNTVGAQGNTVLCGSSSMSTHRGPVSWTWSTSTSPAPSSPTARSARCMPVGYSDLLSETEVSDAGRDQVRYATSAVPEPLTCA